MISIIVVAVIMFFILLIVELLASKKIIKGETARKAIHISGGIVAAFLPFWISYKYIAVLAVLAIMSSLVNTKFNIFNAGGAVKRRTYGDLLFGIGIFVAALLEPNKWLFAGAILQVALADGVAAIIGSKYGKKKYSILGNKKSIEGSLGFYITSLVIVVMVLNFGSIDSGSKLAISLILPPILTLLESLGVYGTDNLTLPLSFLILLKVLNA